MATDDSRAGAARRRTIHEIAADGMELPLVRARTEAARALARADAEKKAAAPLGSWADDLRGCPNAVLRSSLFCAGKPPAERVFYREYKLASSLAPYEVWYTGPRLYQPDLDVWLELVHRCRRLSLGTAVECPMRPTLRALGRPIGKSGRDWLTGTFTLLRATGIHVRWKDAKTGEHRGYIRGLVDSLDYDRDGKCWSVRLDPEIVSLFAPDEHTWVHLDTRLQLGKSYLAKWLHGYFSSHRKPLPVSVERLRSLSGSGTAELWKFRQSMKRAMDEVAFVEGASRRRFEWGLDHDDLVHVLRESGH